MTAIRPLMVLGCTSDAGKSLLVTALCAWFRRSDEPGAVEAGS